MQPAASRGNADNLLFLYAQANRFEVTDGYVYYDRLQENMRVRSNIFTSDPDSAYWQHVAGAFAALSPNSSESGNYHALDTCLGMVTGNLPAGSPVRAYPNNRIKAMRILLGEHPTGVIGGLKVTSFYNSIVEPDGEHVTVDGHMLGAWCGRRFALNGRNSRRMNPGARYEEARILGKSEYAQIEDDFRAAARSVDITVPRFQSTVWLVWKRLHRILYEPQLPLDFGLHLPYWYKGEK